MIESPEGIVAYSWSGTIPVGSNGLPIFTPVQLNTQLNNGNLQSVGNNAFIDFTDNLGTKHKDTELLVLSKSFIETLDLLSEGQIEGPVSGEYIYSGNLGQTGWSYAIFSGYRLPVISISGIHKAVLQRTNSSQTIDAASLRSIYWNSVPVLSDNGQFNFQDINVAFTLGYPNGTNLQTLTSTQTSTRTIGERLYGGSDQTKYYRILNPNCAGININIKIPSLSDSNPDNGNIRRRKIEYNISYRPLFSNITTQTDFSTPIYELVWGKIVSAGGYIKSTNITFNTSSFLSKGVIINQLQPLSTTTVDTPVVISNFLNNPFFVGWEIKISRSTPDSASSLIQNSTYIDSLTELYGNTFAYPCSAIVRSTFSAEFFTSVPERAFECKLLKVKIPGNYDPIQKTYATDGFATTNGYWDGTFATGKAWTNNPRGVIMIY